MRVVSTRVHGFIDYATGLLLILSPWLFGFASGGVKQWLPILLGAIAIGQSLFTDYELGAVRSLPIPAHLALDGLNGGLLAVSPWLCGFADQVWVPHFIIGLFEISMSLATRTEPDLGPAAIGGGA